LQLNTFKYTHEATDYLTMRDPELGKAIKRIGAIERRVMPDLFKGLMSSIIAQQISAKAAETVWGRFEKLAGDHVTPASVYKLDVEEIQKQGMSTRKASYLKEIARRVHEGELDLEALTHLSDQDIIKQLKALPGIGIWTAEMLMIFSLQRPDILSWDDLAIRRGMMNLYGLESLDRSTFEETRMRYSPYGSVASLYLWALSHIPYEKPDDRHMDKK